MGVILFLISGCDCENWYIANKEWSRFLTLDKHSINNSCYCYYCCHHYCYSHCHHHPPQGLQPAWDSDLQFHSNILQEANSIAYHFRCIPISPRVKTQNILKMALTALEHLVAAYLLVPSHTKLHWPSPSLTCDSSFSHGDFAQTVPSTWNVLSPFVSQHVLFLLQIPSQMSVCKEPQRETASFGICYQ